MSFVIFVVNQNVRPEPETRNLFSFAEYLAACCEDEGEENPP